MLDVFFRQLEVGQFFTRHDAAGDLGDGGADDLGDEGCEVKTDIEIGVMIETPAAAMIMDMIIEEVDFVSIGTNDLTQYLLAVDRGNEKVSYLYQSHHPAVLRSIKHIITIADSAGKPVSVCGEMAGEMISFPILIGLGLKRFSMAPRHTVELKSLLDNLTLSECQSLIKEIEEMTSYIDVNKYMKSWFKQKFPDIKV